MSQAFLRTKALCLLLAICQLLLPMASVRAGDPPFRIGKYFGFTTQDVGKPPATGKDSAIEHLAKNLDWLEHQLNLYGTVVPKSPDVWGEARLTAHRQEFEEVLKRELWAFQKDKINAAEYVNDQAFLAFALAVNAQQPNVPSRLAVPKVSTIVMSGTAASGASAGPEPAIDLKVDGTGPKSAFGFTPGTNASAILPGITLEQTEVVDQLANYVNHLHALRRNNEGDDTSDSPGYSMNLVRIPISILPGQHTKRGYGAEITVTAEPYHGPELLPVAFREFVMNDLVDQLSLPMVRFLNADPGANEKLIKAFKDYEKIDSINEVLSSRKRIKFENGRVGDGRFIGHCTDVSTGEVYVCFKGDTIKHRTIAEASSEIKELIAELKPLLDKKIQTIKTVKTDIDNSRFDLNKYAVQDIALSKKVYNLAQTKPTQPIEDDPSQVIPEDYYKLAYDAVGSEILGNDDLSGLFSSIDSLQDASSTLQSQIEVIALPASSTRRSTLPFPPSQLISNYGLHELAHVTVAAYDAFQADLLNREVVHVTDLQAFLREEIGAAYELMQTDEMRQWWEMAASKQHDLATLVRLRKTDEVESIRTQFLVAIDSQHKDTTTAALAWCVYLESILLNDRMVQDIRETLGNQPKSVCPAGWLPYFGPDPPMEARDAFNEYVKVRWPIRVFALDPVVNEQNVGDIRSIYRQMQMSIALSYAGGNVSTSAALQSLRKLQRDSATIDLNRLAVGFGHGDDTFGWRFTPRFQTPRVESNTTVFFRDLVIGGPTDHMVEQDQEIEPGMRECSAIVLMPSFVPHVTFHTRGNWFKLGCRATTSTSISDTVEYSRVVKQMEVNAMQCVQCAHLYRDGEVDRLLKRVHQLDRQLPLQTLECQVPIENTHGGFEICSSGTRELAPELTGWYGAPGYDRNTGGKLFLSGDNFSVTTSSLIVGNQKIPFKLLSRQIMEVDLPPGLAALRDRNLDEASRELYDGYLDAHLATPYGVSGHLLIPVVRSTTNNLTQPLLRPTRIQLTAIHDGAATPKITAIKSVEALTAMQIEVPGGVGLDVSSSIKVRLSTRSDAEILSSVDIEGFSRQPGSRSFELGFANSNAQLTVASPPNVKVLGGALQHHLEWVLSRTPGQPKVEYRAKCAILDAAGNPTVPVDGEIVLEVSLEKTK